MTVSEVRGIGRQRGEREVLRHRESIMSVTKLKLEIAVNDPFVDAVGP
jgi:nitrogen regulatory protein PII